MIKNLWSLDLFLIFRSIYLSGGVTMLPGFVERLEKEVLKLAPNNVPVEVNCLIIIFYQFITCFIQKQEIVC